MKCIDSLLEDTQNADSAPKVKKMKYERESVLVHLSQRLMILQQGAPLPQGDLEKYIRANDSDVKVENELGLSEVPPGRNIMSEVSGRLVKMCAV